MRQVIALVLFASCAKSGEETSRLQKLEQFCFTTRDSVRADRLAFEGDDPLKREAAYERFYDSRIMYHNVDSFLMCIDEVPKLPVGCDLNKNWRCLAEVARDIEKKF